MNLFPVNLNICDKKVVIVGGGEVALRKCRSLLQAQASVTIIAPTVTPGLEELGRWGKITLLRRPWLPGDGADALLIFAATNDHAVNRDVTEEAGRRGTPVCVVAHPEEGTFTSPAVVRRGDLLITVSTGGRSPALSRRVRQEIETLYGPEYADIVDIVGKLREKLLTTGQGGAYSNKLFNELLAGDLSSFLNPDLQERLLDDITNSERGTLPLPTDTEEYS
jgi:precorrin-2 dehydrogenase / sirohydrochlorin ferrochelatase